MICPQCGGQVSKDATFCTFCGANLGAAISRPPQPDSYPGSAGPSAYPAPSPYQAPRKRGTNWAAICCIFLIIIVIGGLFAMSTILTMFGSLFDGFPWDTDFGEPRLLATYNYTVEMDNDTQIIGVDLDFLINTGGVIVGVGSDSMTNHLEVSQEVWTSNESLTLNPSQVARFQNSTAGNITTVSFDSTPGNSQYSYIVYVVLHPDLAVGLTMDLNTGGFNFTTSRDLLLRHVDVDINTGAVFVTLGGITFLNFTQGTIVTNTGVIVMGVSNWNMTQDCILDVETNTGAIFLNQTQTVEFNQTLEFNLDANTGSITAGIEYGTDVGLKVTTVVKTGTDTVNGLPGGQSSNYGSVLTHLDMDFYANTGSIIVDVASV
ncbi:MAG: hypothetical protein ACXACA_03560 [Candidatus Ranarchaeia archaeon]